MTRLFECLILDVVTRRFVISEVQPYEVGYERCFGDQRPAIRLCCPLRVQQHLGTILSQP
jgi:hypothetical protein